MTTNRRSFLWKCLTVPVAAIAAVRKPSGVSFTCGLDRAQCRDAVARLEIAVQHFREQGARTQQALERMTVAFRQCGGSTVPHRTIIDEIHYHESRSLVDGNSRKSLDSQAHTIGK